MKQVYSKDQFLEELSELDGEAKYIIDGDDVFICDSFADVSAFKFGVIWDYAYSDEIECINFQRMGFQHAINSKRSASNGRKTINKRSDSFECAIGYI